jgi:3-phosphoshikimate 1-carboxyvinyltransferase
LHILSIFQELAHFKSLWAIFVFFILFTLMNSILLKRQIGLFKEKISLASSKSESNRAIIINALAGFKGELKNLSAARDTQTMLRLLDDKNEIMDVLDAGTTMRFLTAYFAISKQQKIMTGTPRMCERPIGILVDALRTLGADIRYEGQEGFPPLRILGFAKQTSNILKMRGDVSSQFISAILMIAPLLPDGLLIQLTGEIGSIPYIKMTLRQMEAFGVKVEENWEEKTFSVVPQQYMATKYQVESDWSGASYWYAIVALSEDSSTEIELLGLKENSLQGDSVIVDIMSHLGVKSTFTDNGVLLRKSESDSTFSWDFRDCPDLAQTVAVVVACKNIPSVFTGIESLKVKETDRVKALQNELAKIGVELKEIEPNQKYAIVSQGIWDDLPKFETYDDHRMAMAFAPIAMLSDIVIEDANVVAKSYPSFWEDLSKIVEIEKYVEVKGSGRI